MIETSSNRIACDFSEARPRRRPRVPWLGPCLEARPCSPTLRPLRLGVCRADDGGFAPLEASCRRVAGVSRLYWCNSPRLLTATSRFGTVRRLRRRPPRRKTPTMESCGWVVCIVGTTAPGLAWSSHANPLCGVWAGLPRLTIACPRANEWPHDETTTSNTDCSAPAS